MKSGTADIDGVFSIPAQKACEKLPNPREIPLVDGKTAASDEMHIGQKAVKE